MLERGKLGTALDVRDFDEDTAMSCRGAKAPKFRTLGVLGRSKRCGQVFRTLRSSLAASNKRPAPLSLCPRRTDCTASQPTGGLALAYQFNMCAAT